MSAEQIFSQLLSLVLTVLASGGFWTYLQNRKDKKDGSRALMKGIAHDMIIRQGEKAIRQGWISSDEYENLNDYLYKPYKALGGNGSAERVMNQVKQLPIKNPNERRTSRDEHD